MRVRDKELHTALTRETLSGSRIPRVALPRYTEDAELLLQGHAFAQGVPMREVADAVLDGRLSFASGADGIVER